eukprot:INCI13133.2.p1 GENE.INCI13133.2~~INCI13133.2.p1  ORF type:complete len:603 (-),score=85.16 INCI13133.2:265-2073(-)
MQRQTARNARLLSASLSRAASVAQPRSKQGSSVWTQRQASTLRDAAVVSESPRLLRDYLHDALYDARSGYLWNHLRSTLHAADDGLVAPRRVVDFSNIGSKWEYHKTIDDLLAETGATWISPFELFQPWYGYGLGRYVLQSHVGVDGLAVLLEQLPQEQVAGGFPPTHENGGERNQKGKLKSAKQKTKLKSAKQKHRAASIPPSRESVSQALADRLQNPRPLKIFELGGGSGTVALNILDYLRHVAPQVYENTTYTIVNPRLDVAELQLQQVLRHHAPERVEALICDYTHMDSDSGEGANELWCEEDCFVIGLDLFDNLPRDKVRRDSDGEMHTATVQVTSADEPPTEVFRPLALDLPDSNDNLIVDTVRMLDSHHGLDERGDVIPELQLVSAEALEVVPPDASRADLLTSLQSFFTPRRTIHGGGGGVVRDGPASFIPTGAVKLFQDLRARLPRHRLLATGFDKLPDSTASLGPELKGCVNAPLVSHARDGDLATYLLDPQTELGTTDVFFASDFSFLQMAYHQLMIDSASSGGAATETADTPPVQTNEHRHTLTLRSAEFVGEHVDVSRLALMHSDKFNPILNDFDNVQFLLGEISGERK